MQFHLLRMAPHIMVNACKNTDSEDTERIFRLKMS